MTKSYYDLLKRNKELVEENEKLKSQVGDWKNNAHYRQIIHNAHNTIRDKNEDTVLYHL